MSMINLFGHACTWSLVQLLTVLQSREREQASPSHPHPTGNIMWAVNIWTWWGWGVCVCRNLHRKASLLYILLFPFGGWLMDITGKPDWCPDMSGYPKESEVGSPHLYWVLPSLQRENQRCFQFSPIFKHYDDGAWKVFLLKHKWLISKPVGLLSRCSYLLEGIQQVWEKRDGKEHCAYKEKLLALRQMR